MSLEPRTLTLLLCLQLLVMAMSLSVMTGLRGSRAMHWGIAGLWAQLISWMAVALSPWAGPLGLAVSYLMATTSFALMLTALQSWLGKRPGVRAAWAAVVGVGLVFALAPDTHFWRRGVTNLLMGSTLALLVIGALWPARRALASQPWRGVFVVPFALLAGLTLWRAWVGFVDPEQFPSLRGGHPVALAVMVLGNLAAIQSALAFLAAWRGEAEGKLRDAARTDPLTGLANRRELEARGAELITQARRHGDGLLALLIDLDHFKQVNDRHGHAKGDEALVLTAEVLRQVARPGDCVARLGGEEFVLLLARSGTLGAQAVDERLRAALHRRAVDQLGFPMDYSAGWSLLRAGDRHVHDLLQRADAALYRAKADGRGCLRGETDPVRTDDAV